jgi:hypothetical protein
MAAKPKMSIPVLMVGGVVAGVVEVGVGAVVAGAVKVAVVVGVGEAACPKPIGLGSQTNIEQVHRLSGAWQLG